jgi:hypothetical protein
MAKELTYKDVWDTLSKIDCSDHIEKKMNLSYLSWAWAWGILMENYPDAQVRFYEQKDSGIPYVQMPDGTAEVRCQVKIGTLVRDMWLPVMDYKNNAVENPNARQVSDTKMRCLVKCLAMFGLGHYIYGGEDLPNTDDAKETKQVEKPKAEPKVEPKAEPVAKDPNAKDVDWAIAKTEGMLQIAKGLGDKDSIRSLYKANIEDIAIIKGNFKDQFDAFEKNITELVAQLDKKED